MPEKRPVTVSLEPGKVKDLMEVWGQDTPEALMETLFDYVYRYYVRDGDSLVSKKMHQKKLKQCEVGRERESRIWKSKLEVKQLRDAEKRYCPVCDKRVRYDGVRESFACSYCGWSGTDAILKDV